MQWQVLTTTALYDAKAASLIIAVQTTCLASGQSDPTTNMIANITEELRGAIGFSGKYFLSATLNSLPPNLIDRAAQKIVRVCKRRLEQQLTMDERDDETQYQKLLDLLRRGEYPIDNPDDPMTTNPTTPGGKVSTFGNTTRRFDYSATRYL